MGQGWTATALDPGLRQCLRPAQRQCVAWPGTVNHFLCRIEGIQGGKIGKEIDMFHIIFMMDYCATAMFEFFLWARVEMYGITRLII